MTLVLIYPADQVFEQILFSSSEELADARQILHNIVCRRLYKCLGQTQPEKPLNESEVCFQLRFFCDQISLMSLLTSHLWTLLTPLFPLLSPKEALKADLAQTVPESGSHDVVLQEDDFVVSVRAFFTLTQTIHSLLQSLPNCYIEVKTSLSVVN